jgi:hypothetical protein
MRIDSIEAHVVVEDQDNKIENTQAPTHDQREAPFHGMG